MASIARWIAGILGKGFRFHRTSQPPACQRRCRENSGLCDRAQAGRQAEEAAQGKEQGAEGRKMTLFLGDCLDIISILPDKSIDMILCDLPYGTTQNKWDEVIPFQRLWQHYERIIKGNRAIVLTAAQPFASALTMSNPKLFKWEDI